MKTWRGRVVQVIVGVLVLAVSACAPGDGAGSDVDLVGTRWRLTSYGEPGSETPVLEETEVTLQFDEGGQAGGSGGCNTFGAQYEVLDGTISITEIVSTLRACTPEGVMEQEEQYYEALRTAREFELTDDALTIWYNDGQGVVNFVRIEPS
jgi:heat shock protein HslJ